MPAIVDCFRFFAGAVRNMHGAVAGEYLAGHTSMIRRDPIGVVGSIAPWNYPLMMAAWKLAPALAGGNTVVIKPSEQTPLTALKLAKIIAEIFPEGVVNVVAGRGDNVGNALINHPKVAMVSLTGDIATGQEGAAGRRPSRSSARISSSAARRRSSSSTMPTSPRWSTGCKRLRLLQCRPGLHRRLPHLCRQEDLRQSRRRPLRRRQRASSSTARTTTRTRSAR